jgi:hypothetical protein
MKGSARRAPAKQVDSAAPQLSRARSRKHEPDTFLFDQAVNLIQ